MKISILDLMDFEKVDILLEGFNKTTGFVTAILDLQGKVLSKSGWRQMCTHFHRMNPETSKRCTISDTVLASKMESGEKYHFYKCLNGLVDVAVPIVINGEHVANLFSGQFFFEEPDRIFFKKQAEKYGFDEIKYLEALDNVPVVSREEVKIAMDFLQNMTQLISEMTYQKLGQMELNNTIRESEETYRMLFDSISDAILVVQLNDDNSFSYINVNNVACELYGYTRDEFLTKTPDDIISENGKKALKERLQKVLNREFSVFETEHVKKDGQNFPVEIRASTTKIRNATIITSVIRDVTDRNKAEEELRANEAKFRAVAELSPMAIYASTGSDQKAVYINEAFYKIFGFTIEDVPTVGIWWIRAFPNEKYRQQVIDQWIYNIEQADKNNTDVEALECSCTCKDGSEKVIAWVGKTIGDEFWAFGYDFTERRLVEEQIREKDMQFRKLSSNMSDLIFQFTRRLDGTYCVPIASEGIKKIFGCSPDDVREDFAPIARVILPEDRERVISEIEYSAQHLTNYSCEFRVQIADKEVQWIYSKSTPEKLADGSIVWYGIVSNITKRKLAEEALAKSRASLQEALEVSNRARKSLLSVLEDQRRAQQELNKLNAKLEQRVSERTAQLESANRELETFTYSVSHDLKAPLRGIDGYSKLLLDIYGRTLDEEGQSFLRTIRSSTMQMNQLIDDLLEYSRLERSPMRNEPINIRELVTSVSSIFNEELLAANFILKFEIPDISLYADSKGLHIALRNLLENAIKFTKVKIDPQIEIGLKEKTSVWILYVKDNGIGFDMKYQHRIFEIFQRLHRAEDFPGTGIGLAMVGKAMHRMQGNVWAESTLGVGSTFYLEIPKLS